MRQDIGIARIALAYSKLAYIHALYFGVGLTQEGFCLSKGNTWLGIGRLDRAIRCYRNSLKAEENPRVRALLGWCYSRAGDQTAALESYRLAYKARPRHEIALGLASLEFSVGEKETAFAVLRTLQKARDTLNPKLLTELKRLEDEFGADLK